MDLIQCLLVGLGCSGPGRGAVLKMGPDCSLVDLLEDVGLGSPVGSGQLPQNCKLAPSFCFRLLNVGFPGLLFVESDTLKFLLSTFPYHFFTHSEPKMFMNMTKEHKVTFNLIQL